MDFEDINNSQKLEQILLNFIDVLRINMLIVDSKGRPVLVPRPQGYGFRGSVKWGILQDLGAPGFIPKFQVEGNYFKAVDAFGFQTFAIPMPTAEFEIGYLIVGPVILNRPFEQALYEEIVKEIGIDYADFQESLNEIKTVSFNTLKSILNLLFEISRYALRMKNDGLHAPSHDLPPHSVFTDLLDLSMSLTGAECGSIMLLNKEANELNIHVIKGIDEQKIPKGPIKLDESIAGLAVQAKETFFIDGSSSNRISHLLKKPDLTCSVVLPLINSRQEVLGVMNISTRRDNARLATQSDQILKSLAEITTGTLSSLL